MHPFSYWQSERTENSINADGDAGDGRRMLQRHWQVSGATRCWPNCSNRFVASLPCLHYIRSRARNTSQVDKFFVSIRTGASYMRMSSGEMLPIEESVAD